jgi:hypothetical protein
LNANNQVLVKTSELLFLKVKQYKMAEFLSGGDVGNKIENIIRDAQEELFLVSPYIKLHSRLKDQLRNKKELHKLEVKILFGKNSGDLSKSMSQEDFYFLRDFPNIKIYYNERLHAKYYANQDVGLLSSMNLYTYSIDNNIEFGVLVEPKLFTTNIDGDSYNYFHSVCENNSELIYHSEPTYKKANFGMTKKYLKSEIVVDKLSSSFGVVNNDQNTKEGSSNSGYCIRTGKKIPFNPSMPFSGEAYKIWAKYGDENYSENFCHYSGEKSNGETTFSKPILYKNWKKARNNI